MTKAVELAQIASTGVSEAFKNRIINGAMVMDQRNAGSAYTGVSNNQYTLDRWVASVSQSSRMNVQQNAGSVTPPAGFNNYLGITVGTAVTSLSATDYFQMMQRIEGFNVADLQWGTSNAQTITLSFWVRSNLTGTFGGAIENLDQTRNYVFSYTISAANTWEQKTVTVPGDTTGTWNKTNGIGLWLNFGLGTGTTYSGTAGSWTSSLVVNVTGNTNLMASTSNSWYVTGVQIEIGSTATSFDYRPYGTELALCQRYYEVLGYGCIAMAESGSTYVMNLPYRVTKRAAASIGLTVTSNIRVRQFGVADRDAASPSAGNVASSTTGGTFKVSGFSSIGSASTPAGICYTTTSEDGNLFFASAEL
jgi:hypothetical protein